jgi:hypothetical protein
MHAPDFTQPMSDSVTALSQGDDIAPIDGLVLFLRSMRHAFGEP